MLSRALGCKISERAVERRQPSTSAECERQQVCVGHLSVVAETLPGDVLAVGDLDIVGPKDMIG